MRGAPPPRTPRPRPASAGRAPSSSPGGPARSPTTDGGPPRVGSAKSAPGDPRGHQPARDESDDSYSLRHAEGAFEEIEEPVEERLAGGLYDDHHVVALQLGGGLAF